MKTSLSKGYTLVELIVAIGLFSIIMTLAAGAYLLMISIARETQAAASGIDNLAFASEVMLRTIRTGTNYSCGGGSGDCTNGGSTFSVTDSNGVVQTFTKTGTAITQNNVSLTDPSITITSLTFYVDGTKTPPSDYNQPYATITISGTVNTGPGKTQSFTLETGAAMRGTDI